MYQQIVILVLYFNLHQSWKIPIPPDDGSNRPPMLHLIHNSYSEKLCEFFATDDLLRCQLVLFNWYWIRKDFSVYQFRFGKLTFYAHRWRMYRTDDYDLVEYMLQIRWRITGRIYNETKEFIDQNKMVLFYVRPENTLGENADIGYTDFGHGRGWFSFIFEGEYYSFNLYNLVDANATLLLQNFGIPDHMKWWDTYKRPTPTSSLPPEEVAPDGSGQRRWVRYWRKKREIPPQKKSREQLFQGFFGNFGQNYPLKHKFLMLRGHRDSRHTGLISVTFQFTQPFMNAIGSLVHKYAMPLLAARTINELNGIFKESGTLIHLYIHCIHTSIFPDECCKPGSEVLETYADPIQRISSDLLIVFVHELEYNTMAYPYRMHENKSVVLIKDTSLFEVYEIAHEIGHVLGAGHTPDPDDPEYKPMIYYGQGYIDSSHKCTIMSPQNCQMQPEFSNMKHNEMYGSNSSNNAKWIKQNRFVLQLVGNQQTECPQGFWLSFIPWIVKCLTVDVTRNNTWGLLWCKEENVGNENFWWNTDLKK